MFVWLLTKNKLEASLFSNEATVKTILEELPNEEPGKFLDDKKYCKKIIKKSLEQIITLEKIDTVTLSSTHLLFLKLILKKEFPEIEFIDSGKIVAKNIFLIIILKIINEY